VEFYKHSGFDLPSIIKFNKLPVIKLNPSMLPKKTSHFRDQAVTQIPTDLTLMVLPFHWHFVNNS
jgi:hypothetical protein